MKTKRDRNSRKRNSRKRNSRKNKINQFGGVRFRDIITMENKDQHMGKEVELISIFDANTDFDKYFRLNYGSLFPPGSALEEAMGLPGVVDKILHRYNHHIKYSTDLSGITKLSELVGYSGKLLSDPLNRPEVVVVDYIHLTDIYDYLGPAIGAGWREILIPPNLCSLKKPAEDTNIFYLLQLKRNEPHFDARERRMSSIRSRPALGDRPSDRTDFFTSENFSKLGKSAIKRNVFNPTMETDRFIRRIVDESNKSKRRNRCMKKYSRKPKYEQYLSSLEYIPGNSNPIQPSSPGTRRFTVKKQNKLRDANLSVTPQKSFLGSPSKEIGLNQDILQLLRSHM